MRAFNIVIIFVGILLLGLSGALATKTYDDVQQRRCRQQEDTTVRDLLRIQEAFYELSPANRGGREVIAELFLKRLGTRDESTLPEDLQQFVQRLREEYRD